MQKSNDNDIKQLSELYKTDYVLSETDFKSLDANTLKKQKYLMSQFVLTPPKNIYDIETVFFKYEWLNYQGKKKDVIRKFWDISYKRYDNGNVIINAVRNLTTDKTYNSWDISKNEVNNFIQNELNKEMKKVYVGSPYSFGTPNKQWDDWCNNNHYTAGMVSDVGDIKYIIYGTVKNKSKFNLPIKITSGATLISSYDVKATGIISGAIVGLMSYMSGGQATHQEENLGKKSNDFYIPALPANSESTYAIMLDYGKGTRSSGINAMDWIKFTKELSIENINTEVNYSTYKPNNSLLRKQNEWQKLAINGLPNAKLTDLYRNTDVDDEAWREEYQRMLAAREQASGGKPGVFSVIEKSEADVSVSVNETEGGYIYINIYSDNDEADKDKYFSEIITQQETKEYSNSYDDNSTCCFYTEDFPITVVVSYKDETGDQVYAKISCTSPIYSYTIRVTSDLF